MTYLPFTSEYGLKDCAISLRAAINSEREQYEISLKHYEDLRADETEQGFYTALAWKNEAEHAKYALAILERLAGIFAENLTPDALNDILATFHRLDDYDRKKAG